MKLGQGNYQVTNIEINQSGLLDIELTCSNVQKIHLELKPDEAQRFVNDVYFCVDKHREALGQSCKELANKITPYKDHTWYVKWASTLVLIAGIILRAAGGPQILDFIITIIGCSGWIYVAFHWHDRALLVLNSVIAAIIAVGLARVLFI